MENPKKEKTANEKLRDALILHQIYLLRYARTVSTQMTTILNLSEEDIAERIRGKFGASSGLQTTADFKKLKSLVDKIGEIRSDAWGDVGDYWAAESYKLTKQEAVHILALIASVLPVKLKTSTPPANVFKSIVTTRPFAGNTLRGWLKSMRDDDLRRIANSIQLGMVSDEDGATIARRVVGSSTAKGSDGTTETSRRAIEAIALTGVTAMAAAARTETLRQSFSSTAIDREMYTAVLDSRTTPVCRANDGRIYRVGTGPHPPLHIRCRSIRVPILDADNFSETTVITTTSRGGSILADTAVGAELLSGFTEENDLDDADDISDLPTEYRDEFRSYANDKLKDIIGGDPDKTNYAEWLRGQSQAVQDDTLGIDKARLFRSGKLTLDKFVNRNGDELTLKDLAKKYASIFKSIGLNPDDYK